MIKYSCDIPIGKPPNCPKCGIIGTIISRTKKTGTWKCWSWRCRNIWTTRNTWPRK